MVLLSTCLVAGVQYLIHPRKLGSIEADIHPDAILPVTLLTTDEIFGGRLEQILDAYDRVDDVFTPEFGSVLIEKTPPDNSTASVDANRQDVVQEIHTLARQHTGDNGFVDLPSGPYILHGPNLYQAWRLYEDACEAFNFGVIPEDPLDIEQFIPLSSLSPSALFKSIPVPSRLYSPNRTEEKPLSGLRISIPDVVTLKGAHTTMSSRAWTALYPPFIGKTAPYVQTLLDLGAVIVGKTKISPLATGQQWVDIQAPWNPAGDGYQDPSGSSAGAAVAAAAYAWLDVSAGEDSIGGLRDPGSRAGVFSLRPSFSAKSLTRVQISSERYDTIGLSASSLDGLRNVTDSLLDGTALSNTTQHLVYLDDLDDHLPSDQLHLFQDFVKVLEGYLGTKAQKTSLEALWASKAPSSADDQTLEEFLGNAPMRSFYYDYFTQYQDFVGDYKDKFGGEPFVEASTKRTWSLGSNVTEAQYESDLQRIKTFRSWFEETVMASGSKTIVAFPYGASHPRYRYDPETSSEEAPSLLPELLAPLLQAPHLVVPFGESPYPSEVTLNTEHVPFSASVLGPRDGDATLVRLVQDALSKSGKNTSTGRRPKSSTNNVGAFDMQSGSMAFVSQP